MGGVCGMHRRDKKYITGYWSKNMKERDSSDSLGTNSREISKWMLMECNGGIRIGTGHGL
jgi:hypothetical protein